MMFVRGGPNGAVTREGHSMTFAKQETLASSSAPELLSRVPAAQHLQEQRATAGWCIGDVLQDQRLSRTSSVVFLAPLGKSCPGTGGEAPTLVRANTGSLALLCRQLLSPAYSHLQAVLLRATHGDNADSAGDIKEQKGVAVRSWRWL